MEFSEDLYDYIEEHIDAEPQELSRLDRRSHLQMVHGRMCSGHWQGRLLKMLTEMIRPRRVLELGTFTGYATLCMAEGMAAAQCRWQASADYGKTGGLADAQTLSENSGSGNSEEFGIDTIEIFDENEDFLHDVFAASEFGGMVNLIIGDALEVMPRMKNATYDLIFIDADKRVYPQYYAECKRLLRHGGYMIADNTLWDGHVINPDRKDAQTMGVKRFNDVVAADPEVEKVIIPLRDGLTLIRKI